RALFLFRLAAATRVGDDHPAIEATERVEVGQTLVRFGGLHGDAAHGAILDRGWRLLRHGGILRGRAKRAWIKIKRGKPWRCELSAGPGCASRSSVSAAAPSAA